MSKKKYKSAHIKQRNVHKAYRKTSSNRTKELLETMFPFLTNSVNLCDKSNVVKEKVESQFTRFSIIKKSTVQRSFKIRSSQLSYYNRVYVKDIPYKFARDLNLFTL